MTSDSEGDMFCDTLEQVEPEKVMEDALEALPSLPCLCCTAPPAWEPHKTYRDTLLHPLCASCHSWSLVPVTEGLLRNLPSPPVPVLQLWWGTGGCWGWARPAAPHGCHNLDCSLPLLPAARGHIWHLRCRGEAWRIWWKEGGSPSSFAPSSLAPHSPPVSPPKPRAGCYYHWDSASLSPMHPPPPKKCHHKAEKVSTAALASPSLPWGGEQGSQGPSLPSPRLGRCRGSPQMGSRLGLSPQCPPVLGRASGAKAEEPRGAAAVTSQPWAPREVGAELVPVPLPAAAPPPLGWDRLA